MDLRLEKADLVHLVRPEVGEPDTFHFEEPPSGRDLERARDVGRAPRSSPATARTSTRSPRWPLAPALTPLGMAIGPFSLMTKLLADPISAVALAGRGVPAEEEPLVAMAERGLVARRVGDPPLAARPGRGGGRGRHRVRAGGELALRLATTGGHGLAGLRPLRAGAARPRVKAVLDEARGRPRPARLRRADHDHGRGARRPRAPGRAQPRQLAAALGGRGGRPPRRRPLRQPAHEALLLRLHDAPRRSSAR